MPGVICLCCAASRRAAPVCRDGGPCVRRDRAPFPSAFRSGARRRRRAAAPPRAGNPRSGDGRRRPGRGLRPGAAPRQGPGLPPGRESSPPFPEPRGSCRRDRPGSRAWICSEWASVRSAFG
ncbi:MAG TPA: hypothetical protein EYH07_11850 [Kiloniellaceae bacterium]|nr:hypothetical protein [Kiloniellaceae bacterium]